MKYLSIFIFFKFSLTFVHANSVDKIKEQKPKSNTSYRKFVGFQSEYDLMGGRQFTLLFNLGLRETDTVLDFGCGSLRLGKMLMSYLNKSNYYGIDPNKWLVEAAIKEELGEEFIQLKKPFFSYNDDFDVSVFDTKYNYIIAQSIFSHCTFALIKKALFSFIENIKDDGLICFTIIFRETRANSITSIKNLKEKWIYPTTVSFSKDEIFNYFDSLENVYYTPIKGYQPVQTWIIMSKNKQKIDIIKKNQDNLTDLALQYDIFWKNSRLKYRKN